MVDSPCTPGPGWSAGPAEGVHIQPCRLLIPSPPPPSSTADSGGGGMVQQHQRGFRVPGEVSGLPSSNAEQIPARELGGGVWMEGTLKEGPAEPRRQPAGPAATVSQRVGEPRV